MTDEVENLEVGLFAVDLRKRTIRGVLVPFGETSRPSVSGAPPLRFDSVDDVRIPRDVSIVGLNRMHDRFDPIGRATMLDGKTSPAGLVAEFRVADTPEGDAYLAKPGNLRRLSPEVRNLKVRADGSATCDLVGAALVDEGAFASAGLFAVDKSIEVVPADEVEDDDAGGDAGDDDTNDDAGDSAGDDSGPASAGTVDTPSDEAENEDESEDVVSDEIPNTFAGGQSAKSKPRPVTAGEMFAIMHARRSGTVTAEQRKRFDEARGAVDETALFALSDVDYDGAAGVGAKMGQPAWLGEVLDGTEYIQRFANLFGTPKPLTALAMAGWKWGTKPKGGAWTGNKDAIASNTPVVTPVSENASRWAGGHDHAREHRDFNTPGYFESYYAAMVEDFLRWEDEDVVLTEMLAGATEIEADNPAGLAIGAAMSGLIDGAAAVITAGLIPTFSVLPVASWKSILKTPKSDVLGYLEAQLSLDEGSLNDAGFVIRGSAEVTNTIVGSRSAADVWELPGSPIRVEALDIAKGGIDTGLFGYAGLQIKNAAGIVEVTPYTP